MGGCEGHAHIEVSRLGSRGLAGCLSQGCCAEEDLLLQHAYIVLEKERTGTLSSSYSIVGIRTPIPVRLQLGRDPRLHSRTFRLQGPWLKLVTGRQVGIGERRTVLQVGQTSRVISSGVLLGVVSPHPAALAEKAWAFVRVLDESFHVDAM